MSMPCPTCGRTANCKCRREAARSHTENTSLPVPAWCPTRDTCDHAERVCGCEWKNKPVPDALTDEQHLGENHGR